MNKLEQFINKNKNKNIHIVGFSGAEGSAILEFLCNHGFKNITAHDSQEKELLVQSFIATHKKLQSNEVLDKFKYITTLPATYCYSEKYLDQIENADLIFVSQAWFKYKANNKLKTLIGEIEFSDMTKLYFSLSPCKIIGVTGTKGKSTTSKLISEIFRNSYLKSYFAGNDRLINQVLGQLQHMKECDYFILEISNRQLISATSSPNVAVYTNIFPDHLDDHGSYENYIATKQKLTSFQSENDLVIINFDDPNLSEFSSLSPAKKMYYSCKKNIKNLNLEGVWLEGDEIIANVGLEEFVYINVDEIKLKGVHNVYNSMAAIIVAINENIDRKIVVDTLKNYNGLRYRNQYVKTINGVEYYNDLNSTIPESTIAAINSFDCKGIILIAGGDDKGMDFTVFAEEIVKSRVKRIILLPGSGTEKIQKSLKNANVPNEMIFIKETLDDAVVDANKIGEPGDVVLLSPACAYFFSSYTEILNKGDESWLEILEE